MVIVRPLLMDAATIAGLVLSAIAIVVAAISSRRAGNIAAEQTRIQERVLRLEAKRDAARVAAAQKAELRAEIVSNGRSRKLLIHNLGEFKASLVLVTIDDLPVLEHDLVPKGVPEIREVAAGGTIPCLLAPHMGSPSAVRVRIHWEDGSGETGERSSQLSVFS